MRFIRLCMRVQLDSVNCLEMVQNKEIKMTPHFRCVLMRSGCFWGFLFLFLSCLPTVKTQKSLETPQKHPAACDIVSHTPIVWAANGELYLGDESVSHFIISKHSKQMSTGRLCSPVEVSGPRIDLL